jgi:serine/threonine protein kinase
MNIVEFLHGLGICHRNINPYNIVFTGKVGNKYFHDESINENYKKKYDKFIISVGNTTGNTT